jgi:hypothetical protein
VPHVLVLRVGVWQVASDISQAVPDDERHSLANQAQVDTQNWMRVTRNHDEFEAGPTLRGLIAYS